jgi:DNA-binding MarR family transcriptional regulator/N-acetylglutamate synthase-like GNAT family acetyltransferase
MYFYKTVGKKALGSRLRLLTDKITEDASGIYHLYNIDLQPKWFPVFYVLSQGEEKTITDIAREIGHSHPSVSKIVSEMSKLDLVKERKDGSDGRRNIISLSDRGTAYTHQIHEQYEDVEAAIDAISSQATYDLWKAVAEWEFLLEQKSLLKRVIEQKKLRESKDVQIIDYSSKYAESFKRLNEQWIATYFKMEETDYKALNNPEEYILKGGGHIFVALYQNEPVGVCALIKMNDGEHDFELAKMAVSPTAQGKNIGWLLGKSALERVRELGAKKIYLESNTVLKPAINLYQKLGFRKIAGLPSPYERCNIQMAVNISE